MSKIGLRSTGFFCFFLPLFLFSWVQYYRYYYYCSWTQFQRAPTTDSAGPVSAASAASAARRRVGLPLSRGRLSIYLESEICADVHAHADTGAGTSTHPRSIYMRAAPQGQDETQRAPEISASGIARARLDGIHGILRDMFTTCCDSLRLGRRLAGELLRILAAAGGRGGTKRSEISGSGINLNPKQHFDCFV